MCTLLEGLEGSVCFNDCTFRTRGCLGQPGVAALRAGTNVEGWGWLRSEASIDLVDAWHSQAFSWHQMSTVQMTGYLSNLHQISSTTTRCRRGPAGFPLLSIGLVLNSHSPLKHLLALCTRHMYGDLWPVKYPIASSCPCSYPGALGTLGSTG